MSRKEHGPLPLADFTTSPRKYSAFISYVSADRKEAKKLRRKLKRYRVPPAVRGKTIHGTWILEEKLLDIVRDRDEFSAGQDLDEVIKEHLAESYCLIVICSRACAKKNLTDSRSWVNKEIRYFLSFKGDRTIIPLYLDGIPNAKNQEDECLPAALKRKEVGCDITPARPFSQNRNLARRNRRQRPQIQREWKNPVLSPKNPSTLAPDYRKNGDGRSKGFIKLVSGIIDTRFPILWEEEKRLIQKRRLVASTLVTSIVLAMAGLAGWALVERKEAIAQKEVAEANEERANNLTREANRKLIFAKLNTATLTRDSEKDHILAGHQFLNVAKFAQGVNEVDLARSALVGFGSLNLPTSSYHHNKEVYGATVLGDKVLTWSFDGTAKLWSRKDGKLITKIEHDDPVSGALMINKGILTWTWGGVVRLSSASNGKTIQTFEHNDEVKGVKYFDGKILTWSQDHTAKIWTLDGGKVLAEFKHDAPVIGAKILDDKIATWSEDNSVKFWDKESQNLVISLPHSSLSTPPSFHENHVLIVDSGVAKLFLTGMEKPIEEFPHENIVGAILSEHTVVTWGHDKAAQLWSRATGSPITTLDHQSYLEGAVFSGGKVLTWALDFTAKCWCNETGQLLASFVNDDNDYGFKGVTISDNIVLTWSDDGNAKLWAETGGAPLATFRHQGAVNGAMTSGGSIITWSDDGSVKIWPMNNIKPVKKFHLENEISDAILVKGNLLTWGGKTAHLWSKNKTEPIFTFNHDSNIWGALQIGENILTWGHDKKAKLWSLNTGTLIARVIHRTPVSGAISFKDKIVTWSQKKGGDAIIWRPDGTVLKKIEPFKNGIYGGVGCRDHVLFWGIDNSIVRWDDVAEVISPLVRIKSPIAGAVSDGQKITTWSYDGSFEVWLPSGNSPIYKNVPIPPFDDALVFKNGILTLSDSGPLSHAILWPPNASEPIAYFQHQNAVFGALEIEEGVLTWSKDGTARLWPHNGGHPLATFKHNKAVIGALCNSQRIITWSWDGTAKIWQPPCNSPLVTLPHSDGISGAKLNDDFLATWGGNTVNFWDLSGRPNLRHKNQILEYEIGSGTRLDSSGYIEILTPHQIEILRKKFANQN